MIIENSVQQAILDALPIKRKQSGNWLHFNCPLCHHVGNHRPDTKHRGQVAFRNGGFTFNCFNCGQKTGWYPGSLVGTKVNFLLTHLGVQHEDIQKIIVDSLKIKESTQQEQKEQAFKIKKRGLPDGAKSFQHWAKNPTDQFIKCLEYINNRNPAILDYELYWSPSTEKGINKRFIIPVRFNDELVGFSARWFDGPRSDGTPKYINMVPPGILFNQDLLDDTDGFIIVVEGGLDAKAIDGVGTLKQTASGQQEKFLNACIKEKVVLPDKDKDGNRAIDQAIKNEWSVSFPEWGENIKDADEALAKYGKLFTIDMILNSRVQGDFNINLRRKFWRN